ncbi:phosphatidate cytidylyltransferase [Mesoplasma melaleucae]|uniref:Phosphatidate cytidylyltransferase n=1 Tax=Mesoplasma melaleucae TaxID=81459 RepID=A0A2K8NZA8_9MOLU|nr:phosphatidate cytidylyltransferase [Mesoplasma melaleucae]ATZ17963.1 phosphatidate cytidylyltransferase [Mesoplasma melaleucae]
MTNKIDSKKNRIWNLKNNNFLIRFSSSIILVILLIAFLCTAVLSEELWVHLKNEKTAQIASQVLGIIMLVLSVAVLMFCIYELSTSLKVKSKYFIVILEILALVLFLAPITSIANLEHLFIYKNWVLKSKLAEWYMQILYLTLFLGISFGAGYLSGIEFKKLVMILGTTLIIIFGVKGFTYISLSNDYYAQSYSSIKFGYMTSAWIWLIVILTDTFAYIFGVAFGKHKMAPVISPKKSWEGAIGGFTVAFVVSVLIAILFFFFIKSHAMFSNYMSNIDNNLGKGVVILLYILLAALISFIGQLGDLFFSLIKRINDIKDFSNLIPGHGGVLDRLDSFMLVFLFMYFFTLIN